MNSIFRLMLVGSCAVLLTLYGTQARAQTAEQFYSGKKIDMIIGQAPGGANDLYGRLLAAHMSTHLPGRPLIVPRNVPGAGSFIAVNNMTNVAPQDGTSIAIGAPTLGIDEKLGMSGVHFKTANLGWIGRISPQINIIMVRKDASATTIEQAEKQEVTLAGTGAGSTVSIYPTVMNHMFGTRYKLIMGYKGSNDGILAVERGEVQGHSTAWDELKTTRPNWVRDGFVVLPVQFALERSKDLPNVPTALEFARTPEQTAVLKAILNATEVGVSFFTTPNVPADRLQALRRAFDATMQDPAFQKDLKTAHIDLDPITGEDVQNLVRQVSDLSPELTEKVRAVYQ